MMSVSGYKVGRVNQETLVPTS